MSAELFYTEQGDLYSQEYTAVSLVGDELMLLVGDEWEWQPHLYWSRFGGWTRWSDDMPLSNVAVGQLGQAGTVELMLVDDKNFVVASRKEPKLLMLAEEDGRLILGIALDRNAEEILPLAELDGKRWLACAGWQDYAGAAGKLVIAGVGACVPGLHDWLNTLPPGPRLRASMLAERL